MANHVIFDENIINDFINSPPDFIRFEEHNIKDLNDLKEKRDVSKEDKKFISAAIDKANINGSPDNGIATIPYEYEKVGGRYSAKMSLFNLSQPLKNEFYQRSGYKSLDIVNRNYSIIHGIAKLSNINLPTIAEMVEGGVNVNDTNPSQYYGEGIELRKTYYAQLVYHPVHKEGETDFDKKLIDELQQVHEMFQDPQHPDFKIMTFIEIYATYIIKCVYEYLENHEFIKDKHCVLGNNVILFKPLKEYKTTDIKDIEAYVQQKTKLSTIKLH